jgi:hypothetical protein
MQHREDLEAGLSAIEIQFFAEGEHDDPGEQGNEPRARLSHHWRWVAAIVAVGVAIIVLAEESQRAKRSTASSQPSTPETQTVAVAMPADST